MQKLKELFGGRQGMSSGKKSLADRIVRQTRQRTQGMVLRLNLPPPPSNFWVEDLQCWFLYMCVRTVWSSTAFYTNA